MATQGMIAITPGHLACHKHNAMLGGHMAEGLEKVVPESLTMRLTRLFLMCLLAIRLVVQSLQGVPIVTHS
jgi:hypothetical protein